MEIANMIHLRTIPFVYAIAFALVQICLTAGPAFAAKKEFKPPEGVKVASTQSFDIYVAKKESKPYAATGLMLNVFDSVVVVHQTRKHGHQRYGGRAEAIDADLLDSAMWQVGDFDGDGFDDYRYVGNYSKKGCRTWMTWLCLPERERFTHGGKISYQTDASGKQVKSCR
jgi:hypothetical protein